MPLLFMTSPAHICVIDQDVNSPFPVHQLFQRICPTHALSLFNRGEDLLRALAAFEELPSLVLLSYDRPGPESYQTLQSLKSSAAYQLIPVVVMGRTASDQQIRACYQARANAFIRKALDLESFKGQLEATCRFWLGLG
jgi:CheY-like chemotaxis protein